MEQISTLVCFAVKEEAKSLYPKSGGDWKTVITGMGKRNAEKGIREALSKFEPRVVITSGFAGGLNPDLKLGTVVFDEDAGAGLAAKLLKRGVRARFYCADRIAATKAEKAALWRKTGADAVEMESGIIRAVCREKKIPSATVRVISDAADDDLPLDFNLLLTPGANLSYTKLAGTLVRNPGKISQLMAFQKRVSTAQRELAQTLLELLRG